MKWLIHLLFGCAHSNYTFPQTAGVTTYVCCLDCGKEFFYEWDGMKLGKPVTKQQPAWTSSRTEWLQDAEEVLRRHEIAELKRLYAK